MSVSYLPVQPGWATTYEMKIISAGCAYFFAVLFLLDLVRAAVQHERNRTPNTASDDFFKTTNKLELLALFLPGERRWDFPPNRRLTMVFLSIGLTLCSAAQVVIYEPSIVW